MLSSLIKISLLFLLSLSALAGLPELTPEQEAVMYAKLQYQSYKKVLKYEKVKGDFLGIKGHSRYDVELEGVSPTDGSNYPIKIRYYKSDDKGPRPLIVILPPILGVTPLDTLMASYLARRGFHTMICELSEDVTDLTRPLTDIDGLFARSTAGVRATLDYASTLPEIDSSKIGGFGASLGGIRLSILMGIDSRIKASYLVVAGGNIAEVMAFSQEGKVKPYREARMKEENILNESEFYDRLKPLSYIDPIFVAKNIPTNKVFMLMSSMDTAVPTKNQIELLNALKNPEHRYIKLPHATVAASALLMKNAIFSFLLEKMLDEVVKPNNSIMISE